MALERLGQDARAAVVAATREAAAAGAHGPVEAEHLLLALASHTDLRGLGLDQDELRCALAREEEQSLAAIGVAADRLPPPAARRRARSPKLATSTKLALQRAAAIAARRGDRRIGVRHLLFGVLAAEQGRVPRALALAGVDAAELRARL